MRPPPPPLRNPMRIRYDVSAECLRKIPVVPSFLYKFLNFSDFLLFNREFAYLPKVQNKTYNPKSPGRSIVLHLPNKAVGIENMAHPGKLLLDVAVELLLADRHRGKDVLQGDRCPHTPRHPAHSHQPTVVIILQQ